MFVPGQRVQKSAAHAESVDLSGLDQADRKHPPVAFPIHLSSRSLSYYVPDQNRKSPCCKCGTPNLDANDEVIPDEKQILFDIDFDAKPGELTAILGPSGSGKTTLLDCLAGRMHQGRSDGNILLNGASISSAGSDLKMKSMAGYVKQKDLLFSTATVRETITYAALMRLPSSMSRDAKLARVEEIIEELGLQRCAGTRLGSAADGGGGNVKGGSDRGVSGGELKRVAIAIELITQPSILFLDEPTSGLDSSAAFTLIKSLKRLAESGCTIVSTLHQPRSSIWKLFDKVVLMKDGYTVFSGAPDEAINFFARNGWQCPSFTNPADFVLDVISQEVTELEDDVTAIIEPDTGSKKSKSRPRGVESMARRFRKKQRAQLDSEAGTKKLERGDQLLRDLITAMKQEQRHRPGVLGQFLVLVVRAWRNNIRHPLILWAQLGQHIFLALFVGLMYLQIGPKSITTSLLQNATAVYDRSAAIFFALLNITFVSAFTEAFVFPAERPIFNRERASGHYGVLSYYLGLTASNLPLQLLFVILNATVSYWMIGLKPDFGAYILFVVICLLCTLCIQAATLTFSAVSPSADIANLLMGLLMLIFMSFAGFFLSIPNIPVFFKPFEYLSPYKYAFRSLLQNDFAGIVFNCSISVAPSAPVSAPAAADANSTTITMPSCPYTDGNAALVYLGMAESSIGADVAILAGMTVAYRILVYILLLFVKVGGD